VWKVPHTPHVQLELLRAGAGGKEKEWNRLAICAGVFRGLAVWEKLFSACPAAEPFEVSGEKWNGYYEPCSIVKLFWKKAPVWTWWQVWSLEAVNTSWIDSWATGLQSQF